MEKYRYLQRISATGIIAVIRAGGPEEALRIAEAVHRGGVDIIEVTLTVPGALEVIGELARQFQDEEIIVGAGTVLDSETARAALLQGAGFVVSPHLNPAVIRLCNRYRRLCLPGAGSVTEVVQAMEAGADLIKVFPGSVLGPQFIKAVRGPLPQALMIPTGGVSLENVERWIESGAFAVGVGGLLTAGAEEGDYEQVTAAARRFKKRIDEARELTESNGAKG